jgi:hypothetical protein
MYALLPGELAPAVHGVARGPLPPVPGLLDGIALEQRILLALRNGPQRMPVLCPLVGIEDTHGGRQRIWKTLAALLRRGVVRRIGYRHTSAWTLARDRRPPPPLRRPRRAVPRVPSPTATRSWWIVEPDQFGEAAHARAEAMGWIVE